MTAKFTVLGSTTLATASSGVTFGSIPGGYKDLVLITDTSTVSSAAYLTRFNSDTGVNYSTVGFYGGSNSNNTTADYFDLQGFAVTTAFRSLLIMDIQDYSATDKHKTVLTRASRADIAAYAGAGRWANTNAITTIDISASSNFAAGSTFRLLGVN
tara:strand:- start:103 stop:570 length:468 start_codon:yes stop_codon:yes gene_type:complete